MMYGFIICLIICSFIFKSDAQCNPTSSGIKRFGTDCEYSCHCINNEQCDGVTGDCTSGCDFAWVGPGCQFKNIAYGEESRHIDNKNPVQYAERANDGDLSTCSFTNAASTWRKVAPWWTLWLPNNSTFRKLMFVTQEKYLQYFPNFNLTVQHVTFSDFDGKKYITSGVLCYQHDSSIPQETTVQVTCTGVPVGNLIRLQLANTNSQLVICDFRVYKGCDNGFYGSDCSEHCSSTCYPSQQFTCDNVEGKCLNGCVPGWKGTRCENECEHGKWGIDCAETCGNCFSATCNKTNGHCPNGCDAGFKLTDLCTEKCRNGYYGKNCALQCSSTCSLSPVPVICDFVNGTCLNGCKAGWKGHKCESECEDGKWGTDCGGNCGNCYSTTCNHVNGTCPDGCAAGFKPTSLCTEKCSNGYYGKDCKQNCSRTCSRSGSVICDNVDGRCLNGCKDGWEGAECENTCEESKWDNGCANKCGNCSFTTCNNENGECPNGCAGGFRSTKLCDEECVAGTYGVACKQNCSERCAEICSIIDGKCGRCHTGWTGDICALQVANPPDDSSPVAAIAGVISGVVVAAIIAVGLVLFVKVRRKQQKPLENNDGEFSHALNDENPEHINEQPDSGNIYVNSSNLHNVKETTNKSQGVLSDNQEQESDYYNAQSGHEVLLSKLESYVKTGLANKEYFITQFKQIPYGMQYAANVATKPGNYGKNRYKSMYAYDHSRVILKAFPDVPDSDYINATYIMGYSGGNDYIAAQGPISNTLEDFWRMIWEQNIKTVVMATNLCEEGKMKCIQYWPEAGESVQHGNIIAVSVSEDVFAEFVVRRFKVSQGDKPDRRRIVTHFHYTAWPDKDVPRSTSSLLHFWYQVRKHDEKKPRPWLVHCSAGVGRTGTFIALDIQYDQGKEKGTVDVFKCVDELRKQRVNMVQTKEQYKYLHGIIVEALVLPSQPVHTDKFHGVYSVLKEIDSKTRKMKLYWQYETLMGESGTASGNDSEDDNYTSAKKTENKKRNRYDNILAPNEFRPFLLTQVPGCTDYINAVFIPGYRDKFGYILTQTPMQATAIDCCRLVYEQEVKVIVTFQEHGDDDIGTYLPKKGSVKLGPYSMAFVAEDDQMNYTKRDYHLTFRSEKRSVTQLMFKQWPPSSLVPSDPCKMLYFLEELETLQRQDDNKTILVQCLNGAERSGLVAVLMNIFERLRFDKEVSIPLVIRQLKVRRQQILPNFDQFKFCHDVVLSQIESNSTYANM